MATTRATDLDEQSLWGVSPASRTNDKEIEIVKMNCNWCCVLYWWTVTSQQQQKTSNREENVQRRSFNENGLSVVVWRGNTISSRSVIPRFSNNCICDYISPKSQQEAGALKNSSISGFVISSRQRDSGNPFPVILFVLIDRSDQRFEKVKNYQGTQGKAAWSLVKRSEIPRREKVEFPWSLLIPSNTDFVTLFLSF